MIKKIAVPIFSFALACMTIMCCAACSPAASDPKDDASQSGSEQEVVNDDPSPSDPYVSNEVCLSCHGGTYEALAQITDSLGDSSCGNAWKQWLELRYLPFDGAVRSCSRGQLVHYMPCLASRGRDVHSVYGPVERRAYRRRSSFDTDFA